MRNFNQRFRLRDSDRHIRLLYTLFLMLMLAGFCFSFFQAVVHRTPGSCPAHLATDQALCQRPGQQQEIDQMRAILADLNK